MLKVAVAVVFLALAACTIGGHQGGRISLRHHPRAIHPGPKVVGGFDASPGQFPHQVSIQLENNASTVHLHNCGGSIINEWWILTAGHCVVGVENYENYLLVVAGEHDFNSDDGFEQSVTIAEIFVHPMYPNLPVVAPYDIALLKLSWPLELNERVKAIALPTEGSIPVGDSNSTMSGWGSTGGVMPGFMPSILQFVDMPIVDYAVCEQIYAGEPIADTNVCTGPLEGGISACSGDSGGPLIQDEDGRDVVIGIVSWGVIPCGSPNYPSVFTRVSAYISWINEIMAL